MYISEYKREYVDECRKYIKRIKIFLGYDNLRKCVINQPFPANCPQRYFDFFDNPKAILVTRDPRDIYIMAKKFIKEDASWIPTKSVGDYINFYRMQYKGIESIKNSKDVLIVRFEDLIYCYDDTRKEIEKYLDIHSEGKKFKFFDPRHSVVNTRLFEKYVEFQEEINDIARELGKYLYPFDEVEKISNEGTCFWD